MVWGEARDSFLNYETSSHENHLMKEYKRRHLQIFMPVDIVSTRCIKEYRFKREAGHVVQPVVRSLSFKKLKEDGTDSIH